MTTFKLHWPLLSWEEVIFFSSHDLKLYLSPDTCALPEIPSRALIGLSRGCPKVCPAWHSSAWPLPGNCATKASLVGNKSIVKCLCVVTFKSMVWKIVPSQTYKKAREDDQESLVKNPMFVQFTQVKLRCRKTRVVKAACLWAASTYTPSMLNSREKICRGIWADPDSILHLKHNSGD